MSKMQKFTLFIMQLVFCNYGIKFINGEFCQPRNPYVETSLFPTKILSNKSFKENGFITSKSRLSCHHHCSMARDCDGVKFNKLKFTKNCALYSKHNLMSNSIQSSLEEEITTLVKVSDLCYDSSSAPTASATTATVSSCQVSMLTIGDHNKVVGAVLQESFYGVLIISKIEVTEAGTAMLWKIDNESGVEGDLLLLKKTSTDKYEIMSHQIHKLPIGPNEIPIQGEVNVGPGYFLSWAALGLGSIGYRESTSSEDEVFLFPRTNNLNVGKVIDASSPVYSTNRVYMVSIDVAVC